MPSCILSRWCITLPRGSITSCIQGLSVFQSEKNTPTGIQDVRKYSSGSRTLSEFISLSVQSHWKNQKAEVLYLCMVCRDIHIFFYQFSLLPRTVMVVLLVVASCHPLSVSEFQRNLFILFLLAGHLGILAPSFCLCHHALPLLYSSHVTALMHFLLFSITIIGHFWVRNWSETLMTADITQIIPILAW